MDTFLCVCDNLPVFIFKFTDSLLKAHSESTGNEVRNLCFKIKYTGGKTIYNMTLTNFNLHPASFLVYYPHGTVLKIK